MLVRSVALHRERLERRVLGKRKNKKCLREGGEEVDMGADGF